MGTRTPYVVVLSLVFGAFPAAAQAPDWRVPFREGEAARAARDHETYAERMADAARSMPAGHLNRPFVQYHAARAAALLGRADEAAAWLRTAWEEGIESLMISFAAHDSAFETIADSEPFRAAMALLETLELEVVPLGGSVHLIAGAGANVLVHVGPDGALLVDTGYGPALPALRAALASLGAGGVTRLVVTHPHEDHMGSTAALGVEAIVVAHPGTADAMGEPYVFMEGVTLDPKPASARPEVLVGRDTTLLVDGDEIRLMPTVAHTAGDLSVHFPTSRVAHLGDAYLPGEAMMFPGGDDPEGFLARMESFLDSMHPETVVVPGHGPPVDVDAVRAQVGTTRTCMGLVREAVTDGVGVEEAARRVPERCPPAWVAFFHRYYSERGAPASE